MNIEAISLENKIYERFLTGVKIDLNGCWNRTKNITGGGYSRFRYYKYRLIVSAHRYTYELFKGLIPKGLQIDHLCRNPACCNPDHLEAVTPKENVRRGKMLKAVTEWKEKNRGKYLENCKRGGNAYGAIAKSQTHCKRGHEFNEENTYITTRNTRLCKACKKIKDKEWYERTKI